MRKRRIRRNFGENAQGLTPEDRKAMQTYRTNRGSRRYYEDVAAIDSGEELKPKTDNEPK
jgi:hypothetical protein